METVLQGFNAKQAVSVYAWMWNDAELSDVTLALVSELASPVHTAPAGTSDNSAADAPHPASTSRSAVTHAEQENAASVLESATTSISQPSSAGCEGEHLFYLHTAVLCSNSAYLRTRITTAVGAFIVGTKRSRDSMLKEVIEEGEREAAIAVLQFFYTSQLKCKEGCSSGFLLQMMKVRGTCRW